MTTLFVGSHRALKDWVREQGPTDQQVIHAGGGGGAVRGHQAPIRIVYSGEDHYDSTWRDAIYNAERINVWAGYTPEGEPR